MRASPRSTWTRRPPRRCIRSRGRRCWPRWRTAGPTRASCTRRPAGRQLLDAAREATALTLGVRADEVSFTPSGTTAAHGAVLGAWREAPDRVDVRALGDRALGGPARGGAARRAGGAATAVPVDRLGRLDLTAWSTAVRAPGRPGRVDHRQSRGGDRSAGRRGGCGVRRGGVPLYVDAAQSVGRVPLPAGWSVLTASAHKWGGPPGWGAGGAQGHLLGVALAGRRAGERTYPGW
ncbi:aminotransferase class V-fold PLP-dependent enzyme [Micromonospora sp. M12]